MKNILLFLLFSFISISAFSQNYTHQDSLRGTITPERAWWDLKYYHLDIKVTPSDSSINGSVTIAYEVLQPYQIIQIDLQAPLKIKKVIDDSGNELVIEHDGNAHFVSLKEEQKKGDLNRVVVYYGGRPKIAVRPPWDGGISWDKDEEGNDIIHTNCQGIGASIWWPNKDHMYDEPDSVLMSVNVPKGLMDVSNGRLIKTDKLKDGTTTYHWFVSNPINNYAVSLNIANYKHFSEVYAGEKGNLDMDYYVLPYNLKKAKKQFKDAARMMEAFEYWYGPYPFYEDGYKLVEVPSTGMEHQSAVTYGNRYTNGYRGRDASGTGYGMKFDFIIIHESGHEWFANSITYKDMADMWIHESFTNYSESLFIEYFYGKEAAQAYVRGTRRDIANNKPIIADYGVNAKGSGDMYPKGGNMLNTLRTVINDDEIWRAILRGLNETFYHQTVETSQIESYISQKSGIDLKPFFDQYLRDTKIPILEYYQKEGKLFFRWSNTVKDFGLAARVLLDNQEIWIQPKEEWDSISISSPFQNLEMDPNIYAGILETTNY
ncbi:M1 family metallopeptidase [Fulvivirga sediminis]|uniref:M1 family metallopeptidase n=1 Tax=Fulvivirga sediminis TaxID=2803949 RepID=A0A937F527_9BACT|nr:M1 family metallopeptidase [Fulvivirga sediminis]MBL3655910.1 M1 family metallopeptidase [Fulvivirga sediminis]